MCSFCSQRAPWPPARIWCSPEITLNPDNVSGSPPVVTPVILTLQGLAYDNNANPAPGLTFSYQDAATAAGIFRLYRPAGEYQWQFSNSDGSDRLAMQLDNTHTITIYDPANPGSTTNSIVLQPGSGGGIFFNNQQLAIASTVLSINPPELAIGSSSTAGVGGAPDGLLAVGSNALANNSAFAFGPNASATGGSSFAFGYYSTASGGQSAAMGVYSQALGSYTMAFGPFASASAGYATALGVGSNAYGEDSTALGGDMRGAITVSPLDTPTPAAPGAFRARAGSRLPIIRWRWETGLKRFFRARSHWAPITIPAMFPGTPMSFPAPAIYSS